MKKMVFRFSAFALLILALLLPVQSGWANGCLRVMTPEELTKEAHLIVRAKVLRVDRASFGGIYNQLATLKVDEVVEGDTMLKDQEIRVWAQSRVACAADKYAKGDEMLLFLVREIAFYRTLNYQYGQFHVQNDQVMNWRNGDNGMIAKNYPEVTTEIRAIRTVQSGEQALPPAVATPRP